MERRVLVVFIAATMAAGCARTPQPTSTPVSSAPETSATTASASPTILSVPPLHPSVDTYPAALVGVEDPEHVVVATVAVLVAATPEDRAHGLMEVPRLPRGTGMLFVFPAQRSGGFWMKNTLVPLDIAFADGDGRVLAVLQMVPCETETCEVYDPAVEYTYALEVPAGWFDEVGVQPGWRLNVPPGTPPAT